MLPTMPIRSQAALGLKKLRQRAGYSIRELAELIGLPASTYASYEDKYKKRYLPIDLTHKIAPHFERKGIHPAELYGLAGVRGPEEESEPSENRERLDEMAEIEELDISASAGPGSNVDRARVVRRWALPADIATIASESSLERIKIIRVKGDSMIPTYQPIDRVMVDTGDRFPSPPGVFVVFDGAGFVIKRLQVVPHSEPVIVKFTSDNEKYDPYERILGEAYIQGRVIGKWQWT